MQEQTDKRLRVALIAGGTSHEREVSLTGAAGVEKALNRDKYDVSRYDSASDLARLATDAAHLDFAFILLHGLHGEDGTIQGFLELLGIPYQGSGVLGSALAMDKHLAKELYRQDGLPIADWRILEPNQPYNAQKYIEELGLPLVVKPACEGSSIGISLVASEQDLIEGIELARKYTSHSVMIEQFIDGRELTCAVLGNKEIEALPLLEIIPGAEYAFFNYEAKYQAGASQEICPAQVEPDIAQLLQEYAVRAHQVLHLRGYSRTDFILSTDNKIYLLETNTIPGMTATSILPQEAAARGLGFSELLDRLIELGLEKR